MSAGGGASVSLIWPLVVVHRSSCVGCLSALWFVSSRLLSPLLSFSRRSTFETLSPECEILLLTPITSPLTWFIMFISTHHIMFIVIAVSYTHLSVFTPYEASDDGSILCVAHQPISLATVVHVTIVLAYYLYFTLSLIHI